MAVCVVTDPAKIARIAKFLLHIPELPSGPEELINIGHLVDIKGLGNSREYFCALVHVLKIAREILRQDKLEAALAALAPAPKARARRRRRGGEQADLFNQRRT
jgi:hypothetical protein